MTNHLNLVLTIIQLMNHTCVIWFLPSICFGNVPRRSNLHSCSKTVFQEYYFRLPVRVILVPSDMSLRTHKAAIAMVESKRDGNFEFKRYCVSVETSRTWKGYLQIPMAAVCPLPSNGDPCVSSRKPQRWLAVHRRKVFVVCVGLNLRTCLSQMGSF